MSRDSTKIDNLKKQVIEDTLIYNKHMSITPLFPTKWLLFYVHKIQASKSSKYLWKREVADEKT